MLSQKDSFLLKKPLEHVECTFRSRDENFPAVSQKYFLYSFEKEVKELDSLPKTILLVEKLLDT